MPAKSPGLRLGLWRGQFGLSGCQGHWRRDLEPWLHCYDQQRLGEENFPPPQKKSQENKQMELSLERKQHLWPLYAMFQVKKEKLLQTRRGRDY